MKFTKLDLGRRPIIISGPCSAESRFQVLETAKQLSSIGVRIMRAGLWKPRTKPGGFEGVGKSGLEWLAEAKSITGMRIATEVATPEHWKAASEAGIDIVWIGARTVSDPFAVQALAEAMKGTQVPVLVKNPISPDLELWCGALERLSVCGIANLAAIHRGFPYFGDTVYRNHPTWHIPIELKRRYPELTILCDPSHIGGSRSLIAPLCQQAMDINFDGLFVETHCSPDDALSDASQQITPATFGKILDSLVLRDNTSLSMAEDLATYRQQIDEIDTSLLRLLSHRMEISRAIGTYKKEHFVPVLQSTRYEEILARVRALAAQTNLSPDFAEEIMRAIHEESVKEQM